MEATATELNPKPDPNSSSACYQTKWKTVQVVAWLNWKNKHLHLPLELTITISQAHTTVKLGVLFLLDKSTLDTQNIKADLKYPYLLHIIKYSCNPISESVLSQHKYLCTHFFRCFATNSKENGKIQSIYCEFFQGMYDCWCQMRSLSKSWFSCY